jgi:mannosylglycoprotein endo-beta-mannosidase
VVTATTFPWVAGQSTAQAAASSFAGNSLVGSWQARQFVARDDGHALSDPGWDPGAEWIQAVVPGTVLTTLVADGAPDPYFGRNWTQIPDASPTFSNGFPLGSPPVSALPPNGSPELYTYWFRSSFRLDGPPGPGSKVFLIFRGINYSADVFLNTRQINAVPLEGAFLRHRLDVTDAVSIDGINALAVRVSPPPIVGDPMASNPGNPSSGNRPGTGITWPAVGQTQSGEGPRTLGTVVTPQFSGGWDFVLSLGDCNTGIWDDVLLVVTGPVRFEFDPQITTAIQWSGATADHADVVANVIVRNETGSVVDVEVELEVMDGSHRLITRSPAFSLEAAGTSAPLSIRVGLDNPELWWPNGHGSQTLYPTTVRILVNGAISDTYPFKIGVREISSAVDPVTQGRKFTVNQRDIFIRGGAWTFPDAMLRHSALNYDDQVRLHWLANLNLIRVWGGGIIERPEFYEACDKYGLLVWQEFPNSGDCGTPTDTGIFLDMAADAIRMLRNHASLALWVGANECFPRWRWGRDISSPDEPTSDINVGLQLIIGVPGFVPSGSYDPAAPRFDPSLLPRNLDEKTRYVGSSISAPGGFGGRDGPYGIFEPKRYFDGSVNSSPFNSEYGSVGFPVFESVKLYMDEVDYSDLDQVLVKQETFNELNPAWFLHHYAPFFSGFDTDAGYTPDQLQLYGRPGTIEAFCEQAQAAQYLQHKALYEGLNAKMFTTYTGGNIWRSQCGWTGLKGFLYDYYLEPTAGLFGVRIAGAPFSVHINADNFDVNVVNNAAGDLSPGMRVEVSFCAADGKLRNELFRTFPVSGQILSGTTSTIGSLAMPPEPFGPVLPNNEFLVARMTLKSADGVVIASNLDWFAGSAPTDGIATPEYPYAPLRSLARVPLRLSANGERDSRGNCSVSIQIENVSDTLSFFNRVRVLQPDLKTLVRPAFPSDNYFSLLPEETTTISVEFWLPPDHALPFITIVGWNTMPNPRNYVVPVRW